MLKSLTPEVQTFKTLPSHVFFTSSLFSDQLLQTILPQDDYNAIALVETTPGQRDHHYTMRLVKIHPEAVVTRIDVVNIDVTIVPKSIELP